MKSSNVVKISFKEQMLQAREDAIIRVVNSLLAEKGFEAMTVDEVAANVGIAKASLYKHFSSKEDLAAAAMVRVMRHAQDYLESLPGEATPLENLRAVVRWTMELKLAGEMPSLPSQNSTLRATLMGNRDYMDGLMDISDRLGAWIEAAQAQGAINPALPAILHPVRPGLRPGAGIPEDGRFAGRRPNCGPGDVYLL
jgi:TetR/AcrR family transcriptional regulator of autoinduction and epiphytic fitness